MLYDSLRSEPLIARTLHGYCPTRVRSALRVTSFASAGSPFGSGMFQLMPNSVRSTVVSSDSPTRFLPKWSTAGPLTVPVSVAGRVMPLIVISPSNSILSPSRRASLGGEAHLGVPLGVEEVGRLQMCLQVLVLQA